MVFFQRCACDGVDGRVICLEMPCLPFFLHPRSCMVSQRLKRHSKSNRSPVSILAGQLVHSRLPSQSGRVLAARVLISCTAMKIFFLIISVIPVSRPSPCRALGNIRHSGGDRGHHPSGATGLTIPAASDAQYEEYEHGRMISPPIPGRRNTQGRPLLYSFGGREPGHRWITRPGLCFLPSVGVR